MLARILHLPPPSVPLTVTLYVILLIGCVIGAAGRLPRISRLDRRRGLHLVDGDRHELRQGRP